MATLKNCISHGSSIVCICMLAALPLHAQTTVLAPSASIGGVDQAALSQQWWNWAVSYPPADNPITDRTGAQSSLGDKGSYFFLAGSTSSDPIVRSVTVRTDQTLFFPLVNVVDGYTDEQIAAGGLTLEGIRTETINYLGNVSGLFLKLDGNSLALPVDVVSLLAFRQPTGLFEMIVPSDDNIFGGPANGAPAGTYRTFSDGYWVGLAPFALGTHELHFGGRQDRTGSLAGPLNFSTQDITYRITAVPEPGTVALLLAGLAAVAGIAARRPVL